MLSVPCPATWPRLQLGLHFLTLSQRHPKGQQGARHPWNDMDAAPGNRSGPQVSRRREAREALLGPPASQAPGDDGSWDLPGPLDTSLTCGQS